MAPASSPRTLGDFDDTVETDADDDADAEVDREWLSEVERVLRRHVAEHPEDLTTDQNYLISQGVFRELHRDPTIGEVEEVQCQVLGVGA